MQNFEAFKKSRMAIDPTSRTMTDHQWEQSYIAYKSSRARVSNSSENGESKRRRRSSSPSDPGKGMHRPVAISKTGLLQREIRKVSAYEDLRFLVNILSYGIIALVVGIAIFQIAFFTSLLAGISVILQAALKVLVVVLLRFLVHMLIDIPDVLLYRQMKDAEEAKD